MLKPVEVRALDGYRLWLRYADGTEGEVDLSHLAGKGVFKVWSDRDTLRRFGSALAALWSGPETSTSVPMPSTCALPVRNPRNCSQS